MHTFKVTYYTDANPEKIKHGYLAIEDKTAVFIPLDKEINLERILQVWINGLTIKVNNGVDYIFIETAGLGKASKTKKMHELLASMQIVSRDKDPVSTIFEARHPNKEPPEAPRMKELQYIPSGELAHIKDRPRRYRQQATQENVSTPHLEKKDLFRVKSRKLHVWLFVLVVATIIIRNHGEEIWIASINYAARNPVQLPTPVVELMKDYIRANPDKFDFEVVGR